MQNNSTGNQNRRANRFQPASVVTVIHFQIPADFGLDAVYYSGKFLSIGAIPLRVEIRSISLAGQNTPGIDLGLEFTPIRDIDALASNFQLISGSGVKVCLADDEGGNWLGVPITQDVEIVYADSSVTQATEGDLDIFVWYTFDN
jgi:hypothetical protein